MLDNKYIRADIGEIAYNRPVYVISNRKSQLPIAQIGWYPLWKRYVMYPLENTVWDAGCLESIIKFMAELR